MKIILTTLITVSLNLVSLNVFAIDKNMSVQDVITLVHDKVKNENYKLDMVEDNVSLKYLKTWPVDVIEGLKKSLVSNGYSITDNEQLGVLIDYVSADGEYGVSGKILRSFAISLNTETLYVAIYSLYGGEWSRETEFKRMYIFDSKGTLLANEQIAVQEVSN